MKKNKLIILLRSFEKKEWLGATKFVYSPLFNKRKDVRRLFDELKQRLIKGQEIPAAKEELFALVFPGEVFDNKQLRYVMSFLYQNLCRYLVYTELEADKEGQNLLLLKALQRRNLNHLFDLERNSTGAALETSSVQNAHYYQQLFRLHKLEYGQSAAQSRTNTHSFQDLVNDFDHFFVIEKLQQACIAVSHKTVLETTYRLDYIPAILELLQRGRYAHIPAIQLYHHLYVALTNTRDVEQFQAFQTILREQPSIFPMSELRSIFLLAINFCIRQFNLGNRAFLRQAFELYQEGLSKQIFLDNGHLDRFTYNNIALAGLGLKEYQWTENFLEHYRLYIEERYREPTFKYNMANLHYRTGDYDRALPLLQFTDFSDTLHNMEARKMLAIMYYELSEWEPLDALLLNFRNYIRRQKEQTYHWEHYSNFIHFLNRLLRLRNIHDKKQLELDLAQQTKVAEKEWLVTKFSEL